MNLSFILNYSRGDKLPPVDSWLPPYSFGMYYAFQHYAAALMGRILGLEPGIAYHLAFCTLMALAAAAGFLVARHFGQKPWHAWIVLAALLIGGNGASAVVHAIKEDVTPFDSVKFIGGAVTERAATKPAGKLLMAASGIPTDRQPIELPMETFGYMIAFGDYHAPLSGFFLLTASLGCIVVLERGARSKTLSRFAQAMLTASVPLMIISNAWAVPLQVMLVAAWIIYRWRQGEPLDWLALVCGGVGAAILTVPFLLQFVNSTSGQSMSFDWVPKEAHTPLVPGLIFLGPMLALLGIQMVRRDPPLARAGAIFFAACLILAELIYVNDRYIAQWERFNSTLKWWGWIWCGSFLVAAPALLSARSRLLRGVAIIALLLPSVYIYDLGGVFIRSSKAYAGTMEGWGALLDDPLTRKAFEYLKARPRATVLQLVEADYYTLVPSLAVFTGHDAAIGWPEHERTWRGGSPAIYQRETLARQFYLGALPNPAQWLRETGITHVLWLPTTHTLPQGAFESVSAALRESSYRWTEFQRSERGVYGVWSREFEPFVNAPRP